MKKMFFISLVCLFGLTSAEAKFDVQGFFNDGIFPPAQGNEKSQSIYDMVKAEGFSAVKKKKQYDQAAWESYWLHRAYAKYAFKALRQSDKWRNILLEVQDRKDFQFKGTVRRNLYSYSIRNQTQLVKKLWYYLKFEASRAQSYDFSQDPEMVKLNGWVQNGIAGHYKPFTLSKESIKILSSKDALIRAFGTEDKASPPYNPYYFLSNSYESGVSYAHKYPETKAKWNPKSKKMMRLIHKDRKLYASNIEALYQAQKAQALGMKNWKQVAKMDGSNAREVLQGRWQKEKGDTPDAFMLPLLKDKFMQRSNLLARHLIYTGHKLLVLGNDWGDRRWGMERDIHGHHTGENQLGMVLMKMRQEMSSKLKNNDWNFAGWFFAVREITLR